MRTIVIGIITLGLAVGCTTDPAGQSSLPDSPPVALHVPEPVYPIEMRKAGVTGQVIVEFIVSVTGNVVEARAVSAPHPLLALAAEQALLKAKFKPGIKNGRAVNTRLSIPIYFSLDS